MHNGECLTLHLGNSIGIVLPICSQTYILPLCFYTIPRRDPFAGLGLLVFNYVAIFVGKEGQAPALYCLRNHNLTVLGIM